MGGGGTVTSRVKLFHANPNANYLFAFRMIVKLGDNIASEPVDPANSRLCGSEIRWKLKDEAIDKFCVLVAP